MGVDRRRSRGSKFETKKDTLERRTRKQMWKMTEVNSKKGRSRWRQTRKLLQQFGWDWWNLFLSYTRWNVDFSFPSGTVWKSHCTGGPWGTITRFWKTRAGKSPPARLLKADKGILPRSYMVTNCNSATLGTLDDKHNETPPPQTLPDFPRF